MKKNVFVVLIILVLVFLGVGLFFVVKEDDSVPSETETQSPENTTAEEILQLPVDSSWLDLLKKMKIVKDTSEFDEELLGESCDKYQAYKLLNTMKGQDGADVSASYQGQQITQEDLLTLYLKELFGINVKEAANESFDYYANTLEIKDYFSKKEAEATNNNLISLAYACALYGLDDWENTKTVFQQMLESGFFNDTDITTFENAQMDHIFNYGTNKCPATEVYDKYTGRVYYFVDYFGNRYNSSTMKNASAAGNTRTKKELLVRPYFSQQHITADGTGFICTRCPGGQTYLYDTKTQTFKYIDTVKLDDSMMSNVYLTPSDTLYYIKEVDGINTLYRKNLKSDSEPEKIVAIEGSCYIHVMNDDKYASVYTSNSKYLGDSGARPIIRIDLEKKEWELLRHQSLSVMLPGSNNILNHIKINPAYPELYFFAHDFNNAKYVQQVWDRANILNVDTGEVITIAPGIWEEQSSNGLPTNSFVFTHESWSENGEYLYITNMIADGEHVPCRGMIRVNKDGTHRLYISNPEFMTGQAESGKPLASVHGAASGDDRYCVTDGYYVTLISQETNQVFPIAHAYDQSSQKYHYSLPHPWQSHPTVSRGDSYVVNWGQVYVPPEEMDSRDPGSLGVAWFDFTDIDEKEVAKGGEFAYNEYVSRLSFEGLDCESEAGAFFEKEAIHAKAGNFATFNIDTSIVDSINDTVTINFEYYDNGAQDLKLIYTKAVEDEKEYCYSENGLINITCTNTGEWKKAEIVVHGDFETSGKYGTDFKIGSETSDVYITNIEVKKN